MRGKILLITLVALFISTTIYGATGLPLDPLGQYYGFARIKAPWLTTKGHWAYYDTTTWKFAVGDTTKSMLFCSKQFKGKAYDVANQTGVTVWGFSSKNPDIDNRQYWYLQHSQTNTLIGGGLGAQYFQLDALKSWGQLTFTGMPNNNQTMAINSTTITAKTTGPVANQFRIGASIMETIDSLVTCINAGSQKNNVTAARVGSTCVVISDNAGSAYNYVFTETFTNVTISGSGTMTGGRNTVTGTPRGSPNHFLAGRTEIFKMVTLPIGAEGTADTVFIGADTIATPIEGMIFVDTTANHIKCFINADWRQLDN